MRKILFSLILLSFLSFGLAVLAQDSDLPDPGLTPDSPFYFLKSWKETIQTFFTFGEENKAKQFLHLSEVRLAEYQKMVEKQKTEIAQKTLDKYEKQLNHALEKVDQAQEKGKDVEKLKEAISEKILKHQEVLNSVLEKVPEQAKEGVKRAIDASQKGFEKAIEAVTGEKKEELERKAEEVKSRVEEKIEKPIIGREPTEIKYYTCPDGTKVESGKCYGEGATLSCGMLMSPELKCPASTPPVASGGECATVGETKYYQCPSSSQVSQVTWCVCGPEGGWAGAKNKWQCQHLPELSCSSATVNPDPDPTSGLTGITPTPGGKCTPGEVRNYKCSDGTSFKWCTCDDLGWDCGYMYKYAERLCPATKEITLETGQPKPATCALGEAINQKCADGTIVRACICEKYAGETETWECGMGAICPKSGSPVISGEVVISDVNGALAFEAFKIERKLSVSGVIRITWTINEPVTSRLEYGPTTSYGFIAGTDYFDSTYQGVQLSDLQPNTTYHFRITMRDKDAQKNTVVSEDYTFTTNQ